LCRNFYLEIAKGTSVSGSAEKADFYFIGVCSSVSSPDDGFSAVLSSCRISDDLSRISFEHSSGFVANQTFRIQFQV
jgi:hypothetical protein